MLKDILLSLGDVPRSLSEPDVILVTDETILTIEVKYQADNTVDCGHRRFHQFTNAAPCLFKNADAVAAAGYYELTRNLVFTKLLADKLDRSWKVINLGMPRIRPSAMNFAALLNNPSVFECQTWPEVCRRIAQPRDAWFQKYLHEKALE